MVRLGMMAAVLATAALLGSPDADACERHAAAAATAVRAAQTAPTAAAQAPSPAASREVQALPLDARAHEDLVQAGQKLLAAKCDCESKADCTCKKGQCKCSKCKGRHEVLEALQQQGGEPPADSLARNDATAGVLL